MLRVQQIKRGGCVSLHSGFKASIINYWWRFLNLLPQVVQNNKQIYLTWRCSFSVALLTVSNEKRENFYLPGCMFSVCIAKRTEIAPNLVLNFLLFQPGAPSQTTDVVLQSKIRPQLDEKPDLCTSIIPDRDGEERLEFESWYISVNTA